jgi:hypothetical protein
MAAPPELQALSRAASASAKVEVELLLPEVEEESREPARRVRVSTQPESWLQSAEQQQQAEQAAA